MILQISPGKLDTVAINAILRIGQPFLLTNNKAPFAVAFPVTFTEAGELHPDSMREIIEYLETLKETKHD